MGDTPTNQLGVLRASSITAIRRRYSTRELHRLAGRYSHAVASGQGRFTAISLSASPLRLRTAPINVGAVVAASPTSRGWLGPAKMASRRPPSYVPTGRFHSGPDTQELYESDCDHDADQLADSSEQRSSCCANHSEQNAATTTERKAVVGLHALHCHGGSSVWIGLAATVLPTKPLACAEDRTPGEWLTIGDNDASCVVLAFDPPPPRV